MYQHVDLGLDLYQRVTPINGTTRGEVRIQNNLKAQGIIDSVPWIRSHV